MGVDTGTKGLKMTNVQQGIVDVLLDGGLLSEPRLGRKSWFLSLPDGTGRFVRESTVDPLWGMGYNIVRHHTKFRLFYGPSRENGRFWR